AGHRPRRGFKCVRVWTPRLQECALSPAHPLPGVQRIRGSGDPSSRPSQPRWAARLGPDPTRLSPARGRGRAPVRLPLQAAPRGIGNRQEMTRTASLRLCSRPSLF
ncbi:hypothetical protein EGM_04096, partial [Macaca fascicularis]